MENNQEVVFSPKNKQKTLKNLKNIDKHIIYNIQY